MRLIPAKLEPLVSIVLALGYFLTARWAQGALSLVVLFVWLITLILLMAVDWVSGTLTLLMWLGLGSAIGYGVVTYSQVVAILVAGLVVYAALLISIPLLGRWRVRAPPPTPKQQYMTRPVQKYRLVQRSKPPQKLEAVRRVRRFGLVAVGSYSPSGLQLTRLGPPVRSEYLPDWIEATLENVPGEGLRLTVDGREVLLRDVGAEPIIDAVRNLLPDRDRHLIFRYHVDEDSVWRAIARAYQ